MIKRIYECQISQKPNNSVETWDLSSRDRNGQGFENEQKIAIGKTQNVVILKHVKTRYISSFHVPNIMKFVKMYLVWYGHLSKQNQLIIIITFHFIHIRYT